MNTTIEFHQPPESYPEVWHVGIGLYQRKIPELLVESLHLIDCGLIARFFINQFDQVLPQIVLFG